MKPVKPLPEDLKSLPWDEAENIVRNYRCGRCHARLEFEQTGEKDERYHMKWRVFCPKCGDRFRPMDKDEVERMEREDRLYELDLRCRAGLANNTSEAVEKLFE